MGKCAQNLGSIRFFVFSKLTEANGYRFFYKIQEKLREKELLLLFGLKF